jgi:hypothetical protein
MTATRLDGFSLFASFSANQEVFADQEELADKAAQGILLAALKSSSLDLDKSRCIYNAIGTEPFALALDLIGDRELLKLLKKIDPYNADAKLMTVNDIRLKIASLAGNQSAPTPEPARSTKRNKNKATQETVAWPTSVGARPASPKQRGNKSQDANNLATELKAA